MNTVFVTGGAGFIGSSFTLQWLAEEASSVLVLDKLTYAANLDSLAEVQDHARFRFERGDIANQERLFDLLSEHHPHAVINFAAETHVDRSIDGPEAFVTTNVVGTCRLLETVHRYWKSLPEPERSRFRFLHVSTDEVYGALGPTGRFSESSPYAPNSPYSASKAASDHFVRAYHKTYGVPTLITNCSNNYGPRQFPEKLIPLMILNALEGKPCPVYGDGQNVRDWLYVEDHCRAIRTVLHKGTPGEVYNIGGDCERTNLQVVQSICSIVDRFRPELPHHPCSSLITFVEDRPGHDRRYAIDSTKIQHELDWRPEHDFESGLERTITWYLENESWVQGASSGSYRRERLGLGT